MNDLDVSACERGGGEGGGVGPAEGGSRHPNICQ